MPSPSPFMDEFLIKCSDEAAQSVGNAGKLS
jgi:hypothetical protein